ncbi:MAG: SDR family oxidoreductase [Candidatus Micrarchaeota archaeon]|nr:SDR family oxidoreductase [Candidatus Micrarchaeota archaeon]MDE1823918.1 SDR family oxidoreductase [Candidatus Micrarchaeota archaeon]MDE1849332.1 SDR family oxidoreductase [Candidatus Micrarchaeota archaeon]
MNVLDSFRLDGKIGIVTGVSSGLGVSFATALAEAGADLIVCARREDKLKANAEGIAKSTGRQVVPVALDVTKESMVARTVKAAEEKFGKVDILINNAGIGSAKPAVSFTEKEWLSVLNVDLNGTFYCAKEAAKSMIRNKVRGRIINIASIYGLFGDIIPAVPYYAAKGAVVNMTRALAVEWVQYGIRVNAIAPGFFPSEMTKGVLEDKSTLGYIQGRTPMGRLGDPDELKGAAVYLASDASSYVTGLVLKVDGGWSAR